MITSFDIEGSEEFKEAVRDFIEFRKEKKKPLTARGFELFIRKLDKLADDEETKIKIIEQSIENSWTGVFPLHFDVTAGASLCPTGGSLRRANVKPSGFNNFTQKEYDYEQFEKDNLKKMMEELKPHASGKSNKGPIRPTRFSNFEQAPTDFETIRRKKREQLIQEVGRCNDN